MTDTIITLRSRSVPAGTPLVIEVLDADLDLQWRGTALMNTPVSINKRLAKGSYAVIVSLPSGQSIPIMLRVTEAANVELEVPLPSTPARIGLAIPSASPLDPTRTGASSRWTPLDANLEWMWVRLWSRDAARRWRAQRWTTDLHHAADGSLSGQFEAGKLAQGQNYIQIGGGSSRPRVTAIPAGRTSFLLRPSPRFGPENTAEFAVDVDVYPAAPETQALIGYLSNGDLEHAQIIGEEILATRVMGEADPDPTTAVLGAYYLLACRDLVRLEQVIDRHLSKWSAWLPDYAVIAAWQCLRQQNPDVEKARDHFVDAVTCGVPVYTRGLRLLLDGLRMVEADEKLGTDAVREAFKSIRGFARVADWRPTFTTFLAVHPGTPINPRGGIRWLKNARQAASDPLSHFPWAPAGQQVLRDRREFQTEMQSHFSASFSRAFAYPPGQQNTGAAVEAYRALQENIANLVEPAS